MCGITAIARRPGVEVPEGTLSAMNELVAHRGPDGSGADYLSLDGVAAWRVAIAHRRLKILDLTNAGRQPMVYRNRLWLSYNGEVYNYLELRRELERLGHAFHSRTDTEVILGAYDEWGSDCWRRLRGMWGLVLVDLPRKVAVLSRDRLGIKPLYVTRRAGLLAVASEIKQFRALPGPRLRPNPAAVRRYLATGYEDSAATFFAGVVPVPAGTCQYLNLDTLDLSPPEPYWFPERIEPSITRTEEAAKRFRSTLCDSVRLHMRSDVSVGCALSGGLDSSAVAGCATSLENGEGPHGALPTFSVTFPNDPIDERAFVDRVVASIPAAPHFVTPTAEKFLADLDDFVWKHDEPVGSLSQYAGYALARLTHEAGVAVLLNGQGGDEVLSGYWQCYFVHLRRLARHFHLLQTAAHLGGALLRGGNPQLLRQVPRMFRRFLDRRRWPNEVGSPLHAALHMTAREWRVYEIRELILPRLLKWDDRNFMAFSVEGRYPFLDHNLIELCLSFAPEVLYDRGWTKEPLRRGLEGLVPHEILRRPGKIGFETPQGRWLAKPLASLVDSVVRGDSPAWQFTDAGAAGRRADRVGRSSDETPEDHQALLRIVMLDRWLRRFELN